MSKTINLLYSRKEIWKKYLEYKKKTRMMLLPSGKINKYELK